MNEMYRVKVTAVNGEVLMLEFFEDAHARDAFVSSVMSSDRSVLDGLPGVDSATVEVS